MKAPEKIYLYPYSTDGIYEVETKPLEGTVEYTQTDGFVEKAAEWIKNKAENYIVETHLCSYFDYKRAVEDFREYMKGE